MITECRGELIDNPTEADVVFDDKYVQELVKDEHTGEVVTPEQTIIRSWELEKLVALVNS
jgi:hypothetical protein